MFFVLGCVGLGMADEGRRGWGCYKVMFRMASNNRLGIIV